MSDWERVGVKLRTGKRKAMAQHAPTHERCDGCGLDVSRGTLRNVPAKEATPVGHDGRGDPYYRLEDYRALCRLCYTRRSV